MMVLAMRAARVTTSVMSVILPRGRDLLPICPSQPGPRGLNTVGSLRAPQSPVRHRRCHHVFVAYGGAPSAGLGERGRCTLHTDARPRRVR